MPLTDKLSAIAAAIRAKGGTSELLTLAQMPQAIADLPSGGSAVINPLSVTSNGTYTAPSGVDGFSPVTVNVPADAIVVEVTPTSNHGYISVDIPNASQYSHFAVTLADALSGEKTKSLAVFPVGDTFYSVRANATGVYQAGAGGSVDISGNTVKITSYYSSSDFITGKKHYVVAWK